MRLFKPLVIISIFLSLTISEASSGNDNLTLLYFFSSNCPHCARVKPIMKELSAEYPVQGLLYGNGAAEQMPFDVKPGDKATSSKYGLTGVPSLVILQNSSFRMKISGEHDIVNAPLIMKALKKGALSVSEAVEKGGEDRYIITGWLVSRGEYFKDSKFFLTDRRKTIPIKPWLPLEAVKAPMRKTRPRLMSDVVDKVVLLEGTLTRRGSDIQFIVGREISID